LFSRAFLLPESFEKFVARHAVLTLLDNKHILNGRWARQFSYQFFEFFKLVSLFSSFFLTMRFGVRLF
jgi:hypothetical protein